MAYDLPALSALRAFEAAARNLSFKHAAEELHVTAGAISQQIKRLEQELGVALFVRTPSTMLTPQGQAYLAVIRRAFERISEVTTGLRDERSRRAQSVTVNLLPGLATKWLIPRLGRLRNLHPDLDVRISTSRELVDFTRDDVDIAIRHGLGIYPGLKSWKLFIEDMVPVCSPSLLKTAPLRAPSDLRQHTLLHDQDCRDWELWLRANKVEGIDATRGLRFSDDVMMLAAAAEGHGVALGRSSLIAADVASGQLVRPLKLKLTSSFAYYVVCPERNANIRKIALVRDWLLSEAKTFQIRAQKEQ
ncbi:transcriptional regulator GcvA [Reyranella sp. CPCC 100927]|uniref:transcriptional regulator GcvA n=1 Tax=Reyranella sp. CPCC 100927 TaxID=2599616 RepID=UPI0011B7DAE7|nr:transcriptional regulator GcvA [Reyranella sp. CPCC 100927]TWT05941.1 transcriptional regulator GcvA [Reyranella sp. CPCC 100927]